MIAEIRQKMLCLIYMTETWSNKLNSRDWETNDNVDWLHGAEKMFAGYNFDVLIAVDGMWKGSIWKDEKLSRPELEFNDLKEKRSTRDWHETFGKLCLIKKMSLLINI